MGSEDTRVVSKDHKSLSSGCLQSGKLPMRFDGKSSFYSSSSLADSLIVSAVIGSMGMEGYIVPCEQSLGIFVLFQKGVLEVVITNTRL